MTPSINRRGLVLGIAAGAALTSGCATARRPAISLKGVALPSESVQMSAFTEDAQTGFVCRLCRYPTAGVAWVWAHVFEPGRVWSYTDDQLPTSGPLIDLAAAEVSYRQAGGADLTYRRTGPRAQPTLATLDARLAAHDNPRPEHGRGATPVRIQAELRSDTAQVGILPDRAEAKGKVDAVLTIGGRTVRVRGSGHFHEQPQSTPRFVDPFTWLRGSGEDVALTFARGAKGPADLGGYLTAGGRTDAVTGFRITPPGPVRRYETELESGRRLSAEIRPTHTYWVRIYDGWRNSQIFPGEIEGRRFVGGLNDWMSERLSYLPA
jgi:hypothetical protein